MKTAERRLIEKVLGAAVAIAGIAMVGCPEQTASFLCNYKVAFGIVLAVAGGVLFFRTK